MSDDDSVEVVLVVPPPPKKQKHEEEEKEEQNHHHHQQQQQQQEQTGVLQQTGVFLEAETYEFCCAHCKCPPGFKLEPTVENSFWGVEGQTWHRLCCHGHVEAPPIGETIEINPNTPQPQPQPQPPLQESYHEVIRHKTVLTARRIRQAEADLPLNPFAIARTHPAHHQHFMDYQNTIQQNHFQKVTGGIVLLDVFGGIGTSLVALQKNNILVKKCIHVEIDRVAHHVRSIYFLYIQFFTPQLI
jgi:hypothetical protein